MCGILSIFNDPSPFKYEQDFKKGNQRGPDISSLRCFKGNIILGFHRLSINGLDDESNQPLEINNCILTCNGEIYNYKEIYKLLNIQPETNSDCEVIIHLYKKFGIEYTLQILDGVFAFTLLDLSNDKAYIARDPYGVRPLFMYKKNKIFMFSSEIKMISNYIENENDNFQQVIPGSYYQINIKPYIAYIEFEKKYTQVPFSYSVNNLIDINNENNILENINNLFKNAVKKRIDNSDREICCLLSGGLDSSLVCAIAQQFSDKPIKTYSIGLKDSVDLINARSVAKHINSEHHEVIVSEEEFLNAIPDVIYAIESYDTTTVRASVGNYLISKYIKETTDCKVILNGDGADELMGGYLYFSACNDIFEFDKECKRLLKDIGYFDVLRSDKSISSNGLEARTPFLDRTFVQYYLSLSPLLRSHSHNDTIEKYLIRTAFEKENILPNEVLWRKKEAFSDGVSGLQKSWSDIIKEYVEMLPNDLLSNINKEYEHNNPTTKEQQYYRYLFETMYPNCSSIIPYFWMPKFIEATDSSARTLSIYNS